MKRLKLFTFLLVIAVLHITTSATTEVILQNGLNNYTGCCDTYIDSENPYDINYLLDNFIIRNEVYIGG